MNGTKFQLYFSTDGSVFNNLRSAVEFMMKDSEVTAAQRKSFTDLMEGKIYQMEMSEGDWVRDETLPSGWMKTVAHSKGIQLRTSSMFLCIHSQATAL